MNTKLTLRMDERLIRRAKSIAHRSGKSVSELVADYFRLLGSEPDDGRELTPVVRSLLGIIRNANGDRDDYRRHLVEKYR